MAAEPNIISMSNTKSFDRAFITGCDNKTEWMLPWFLKNYRMHNETPIVFVDFGVSSDVLKWCEKNFDCVYDLPRRSGKLAWFHKPDALIFTGDIHQRVWIDTDCEVLGNLSSIFLFIEPQRLAMVQDIPWTNRRGEIWHNSGVVGVENHPQVLTAWANAVSIIPAPGDQEVLHQLIGQDPLRRRIYITDLPNKFNWLRLQLLDGQDSPKKLVMHWTGQKGKDVIREKMK